MIWTRSVALLGASALAGCLSPDVSVSGDESTAEAGSDGSADESTSGQSGSSTGSGETTQGSATTLSPTTGVEGECEDTPVRVATFNIEAVSSPGSDPFVGLSAVLGRIGADVVCVQEINEGEDGWFSALATDAGYDTVVFANESPAIGGDIYNACISRIPMELIASYGGSALSTDPSANDVGRDILAVRVEPEPGCFAALFTVHLKSGGDYEDLFRRQVEAERLARGVRLYRENRPAEPVVVLGDFNEQLDDTALGTTLDEVPSSLPGSYSLGNDIDVPLRYHPFDVLTSQGFQIAAAFQEDSGDDGTFVGGNFNSRLDYVVYGQAILEGAEVYNACADNGTDDAPPGGWLPKEGEPLACYSTQIASDHLPIFADFTLR